MHRALQESRTEKTEVIQLLMSQTKYYTEKARKGMCFDKIM